MQKRRLATAALLVVAGLPAAGQAQGLASTSERHCVVWVSPTTSHQHSKLSKMQCFSDFQKAQRFARGPAPTRFAAATDSELATASTTISIDYDSSGFSGTTLTWTVANSSGCNGFTYSAASMPSGWNDRVSSSHSYGGCAANRHFHDSNFGGAGIVCTCSTMGTMTNQTSSERWAA